MGDGPADVRRKVGRSCDQSGDMLVSSGTQDIVMALVASTGASYRASFSVNSRLNCYLIVLNDKKELFYFYRYTHVISINIDIIL